MSKVLSAARELVTPSESEKSKLGRIAERMLKRTANAASRFPQVRGVLLGGSFARDTWLPGAGDVDIFIKVSPSVEEKTFEDIALRVGRDAVRGYPYGKKYAQHPYTEAKVDGVRVNIVPCYDVKPGEWKSAADRSQYHVEFVKKNLNEEMRVQARLLKRFMGTIGVYGAEIEKEGFSGYLAEVLVYREGSFENVVKSFANFRPASDEKSFSLVDPVDEKRDLGRAISRESVARMVLASRAYMKQPRIEFFKGEWRRNASSWLKKRLVAIVFEHRAMSEDTLWGELKRSRKHLVSYLEKNGFSIIRAIAVSDNEMKSAIILLPLTQTLPDVEERVGPGVELSKEAEEFARMNARNTELIWAGEDGRLHLLRERKNIRLIDLMRQIAGHKIAEIGASKDIADAMIKNGRVMNGLQLAKTAAGAAWILRGIEEIVANTIGADNA